MKISTRIRLALIALALSISSAAFAGFAVENGQLLDGNRVPFVMRGGFSRVEQTLLEGGRGAAVIQQRMEFQELMRDEFCSMIQGIVGRRVIGFMSGNQQDPDLMCEVFILAPTDLVEP